MKYDIIIKQGSKEKHQEVSEGTKLLNVIVESGMELESYCGGRGTCGKCRANMDPAPSPYDQEKELLSESEIQDGIRLACLHSVQQDMEVTLEEGGEISILAGEEEVNTPVRNDWSRSYLSPEEPSLEDQRSYLTRLLDLGDQAGAGVQALKELEVRREEDEFVAVSKGNSLMRVGRPGELDRVLGAAVDIGTTTVVVYLLDLETGRQLAVDSFYNPQKEMGADVISRIQWARDRETGWKDMQKVLVKSLNESLQALTEEVGLTVDDIYRVTFAGNTIMLHGLLGVSSEDIANSPFVPLFCEPLKLSPYELDLEIFSRGEVLLMPSISGYIGGDIVADMMAVDLDKDESFRLLVDIGTNGEVALGSSEEIYTCSVAAGPSFEGGNIKEGMAAMEGAADSFSVEEDGFEWTTISGAPPRGICGSGLLDLVAGLLRVGVITDSGKLASPEEMPDFWQERYERTEENARLMLFKEELSALDRPLYFTQKDIRQLQLAKGAIRAGIEILLEEAELSEKEVEEVYLVGGFANYLDKEHACEIGMIPSEMAGRIYQAGNGAGAGARMMLLDDDLREKSVELKKKANYLELSTSMEFQEEFTARMSFPDPEARKTCYK